MLLNEIDVDQLTSSGKIRHATPTTFVNIRKGKQGRHIEWMGLFLLFDSGASESFVREKYVNHLKHKFVKCNDKYEIAGGTFNVSKEVKLRFSLPEFGSSKIITSKFKIDSSTNNGIGYDMIIGRDILAALGIDISFKDETVTWDYVTVPMKDYHSDDKIPKPTRSELKSILSPRDEPKATQEATNRAIKILDSTYKKADLRKVADEASSLNNKEKEQLFNLLSEFEELFDGTLGDWKTEPVELELREGEKPHSSRYYPMPRVHKQTFKKELLRLVEIGVLEEVRQSEWGSPTFIIPKKQGTVRFISDFRKLNAKIKRKPYPIPRISDVLQQLEGFQYATTLDLNMGYYTVSIGLGSRDLTTIVTEFGKFRYKRLPMGLSCAPDVFQSKINELLGDLDSVRAYIDDVLILTKDASFEKHLDQVRVVLSRMQKAGLRINAEKSSFGINEVEYLGYIITKEGVRPDPKKIQGIMDMTRPTTSTEVRRLIGIVQYYRDLWPRRSHILAPLTEAAAGKTKRAKIKWTEELERAFLEMKKMVSKEALLTYPDWSKPFTIHTDASDFQLGAVISQNDKPIAFFSRKLNSAQRNYTTTEKELLSIVECLKQFRNIVFGYEIIVYSDHKNLVHAATVSESQRVMRWRLLLEEYGPDIRHIKGVDNVVADAIRRWPMENDDEPSTDKVQSHMNELFNIGRENNDNGFPLDLSDVQRIQNLELNIRNSKLKAFIEDSKSGYYYDFIEDMKLILYKGKIYVPESLRGRTLGWYHHYLNHPGGDRLANTLSTVCYWKGLTSQAKGFCKKCNKCQVSKKRKVRYGHLPPQNKGILTPWETVHVDLIGPYSVKVNQEQPGQVIKEVELQLTCMTFLDPATGWFEIAEVPYFDIDDVKNKNKTAIDKSSARISQIFNDVWLSRYPRPRKVIFDNGSEFKKDFVPLLQDFAIKPTCTTIKNPQSNAPVERIHQVVGQMMAAQDLKTRIFDFVNPWGPILTSIAWAIRAAHHSTLGYTPAQLVFGRDMVFNIKTIINWKDISERKQAQVDKDNLRENKKRIDYDYQIGSQVYVTVTDIKRKLDAPKTGPFPITEVFTNGTVRIQKGNVNERINIRRLEPHFS
jgi:hypothetical protein